MERVWWARKKRARAAKEEEEEEGEMEDDSRFLDEKRAEFGVEEVYPRGY